MRSHTTLRIGFRLGLAAIATSASMVAAREAKAAGETACDTAANCSSTAAALHIDGTNGFKLKSTPTLSVPDNDFVALSGTLSVRMDPVKDGGPLYSIDMAQGAIVEASWPDKTRFVLKASNGADTDGLIKVRHTLAPSLDIRVIAKKFITFDQTLSLPASTLITKLPGSRFEYDAQAQGNFMPWGFAGAAMDIKAPGLEQTRLLSVGIDKLPVIGDTVRGTLALSARAEAKFNYKTTKLVVSGGDKEIVSDGGEMDYAMSDVDFLDVTAQIEGDVSVTGKLAITPNIQITGFKDNAFGPIEVGLNVATVDISADVQHVVFPATPVHIPLPNLKAPKKAIDIGDAAAGESKSISVEIVNTGEKTAEFTATGDGAFTVPGGTMKIEPKGKTQIRVQFDASSDGPAKGNIVIKSNDPDSPEQMFQVLANGAIADDGSTGEGDGDKKDGAAAEESGCGCKTAGTSQVPGLAGIGALGLGLALVAARRRNKK